MWQNTARIRWLPRSLSVVFIILVSLSLTIAAAAQAGDKNTPPPNGGSPVIDSATPQNSGFDKAPSPQEGIPGETHELVPQPGDKNAAPDGAGSNTGQQNTVGLADGSPTAVTLNGASNQVVMCGSAGNLTWTTTLATWQVVRQCTVTTSVGGFAIISGTSSLVGADYEVEMTLGLGSNTPNYDVERWVNAYADSGDGSDKSIATSAVINLPTPGTYTFYLYAQRWSGLGTVTLYDPQISTIFVPYSAGLWGCFIQASLNWYTTSGTYENVRSCTLGLTQAGKVLLIATSSLARSDGPYEVELSLGYDDIGINNSIRWVNVYDDAGDGTDETMQTSAIIPVTAGTHTFQLKARRYNGTGTVLLYDPSFLAIFIPDNSRDAQACSIMPGPFWTTTSPSFVNVVNCPQPALSTGPVFMIADGSVGYDTADAESDFELGFDSWADWSTDRWVNVYADAGDGTDRVFADSAILPVKQGGHMFRLWGRRQSGAGVVHLYRMALTAIVPGGRIFMPFIKK